MPTRGALGTLADAVSWGDPLLWPLFLFALCIGMVWLACMALYPSRKEPPPHRLKDLETAPPRRPDDG